MAKADDNAPRYTSVTWDSETRKTTVTHSTEEPRVIVELEDGTRMTLDEYMVTRKAAEKTDATGEFDPPTIIDRPAAH
jgi:hypothetical protein